MLKLRKGINNIKIDLKYYNGTQLLKKLKEFQNLVLEYIQKLMIYKNPYGGLGYFNFIYS